MAKSTGLVVGLIAGAALGVIATIVFGPELDEATRRRLRERGLQWRERADQLVGAARVESDNALVRVKQALDEQSARLQEAIEESKRAAAEKQRELRAKFERAEREGEAPL